MNITKLRVVFLAISLFSVQANAQESVPRPKLVVGLMVDQMRWDYLYRFYDRYGAGGFKRLLSEGFSCENTYIPYVPTYTAIGHSTVYTGSVPAIHGIAGNDFIIQQTGQRMYCTQDDNVSGVGTDEAEGKQSPRNLLTSTITDQLKLATNFRSKVIGIAIKDRGGILPAGHFADAAYWFEGNSGNWVSSTFYMQELPEWVQQFNAQKLAEKYLQQDWNTLYPIETYEQSIEDDNAYEATYRGEASPVFPKRLASLMKDNGLGLIRTTPFGNTLTLDLAKAAIANEQLGRNPQRVTDFLCLSLSSTDYVGHQFSVNAIEIEDTYLRLDKELEAFFAYLDEQVGPGEYTLFLTADHGASHNPLFFMDKRGNAGYFDERNALTGLNTLLSEKFGQEKIVRSLMNYQVHLNYEIIEANDLDEEDIKEVAIKFLRTLDGVAFVTDMEKAGSSSIPARIRERIANGYNPKRSGCIQIILEPQWYSGSPRSRGTTHGTWASYDAHIPLVWMGWGIKHGTTNRETHMTDIASTVAALLHIEEPNGNIGNPVVELLND
ncbi:Type I phosphodiesterase / nucleotide pyrophosphatase [Parapedobacter luteus]|uniref:Type I phosphodiesterase / nucleotide pyrophosphatase n=1 Tax=Parapedobacter luteus TaxID=623280 RepID=A0A1T5F496_9SPHI|nr:alkaline phosphatase PafA [Parapedobacter luteus]SKB90870.1 Type I phosphodiesterase / nucleotide pyrophosphatase [Parapedobacter luteus]